jgi:hypothetical protein
MSSISKKINNFIKASKGGMEVNENLLSHLKLLINKISEEKTKVKFFFVQPFCMACKKVD